MLILTSDRRKRFTKYDSEKYADIKTICGFLGQALFLVLLSFHALTRGDTASYMFRVGKVRIVNKLLNKPAGCSLLATFEKEEPSIENNTEDWKNLHELSCGMANKMGAICRLEFAYVSSKKKRLH